jgi:glycogen debranching enzyme
VARGSSAPRSSTAWGDEGLAARLEREAADLRRRFDEAFWCEARGGYYALSLDGRKQRVDSLASNVGHLLWSGIVPEERVAAIADRLMQEELWSGWGVRTMSTADAGYSPLTYHNGTVWPHDNSLIALGLARCGHRNAADRIVRRMTGAAAYFDYQLPEVFAGFPRSETPFPIAYPTAARPQAWAAGTPILLLQVLLGLEPDRERRELRSARLDPAPEWAGRIRLSGIRAFDRVWHASLEHGEIVVGMEGGVVSESQS